MGSEMGPLERGDILDRTRLDDVLARYRPDAVMHFAAFACVGKSVTDPGKYYRNNIAGSLNLLEAMRNHPTFPSSRTNRPNRMATWLVAVS